jgi:hypothetical protein
MSPYRIASETTADPERAVARDRTLAIARVWAALALIALVAACAGAATAQQKSAAADASYAADMLKCVDDATTLAESKACRAKVRSTWHADGGVEGGWR